MSLQTCINYFFDSFKPFSTPAIYFASDFQYYVCISQAFCYVTFNSIRNQYIYAIYKYFFAIINCIISSVLFCSMPLLFVLNMYLNTKIYSKNTQLIQSLSCCYAVVYCNPTIPSNNNLQFVILNCIFLTFRPDKGCLQYQGTPKASPMLRIDLIRAVCDTKACSG